MTKKTQIILLGVLALAIWGYVIISFTGVLNDAPKKALSEEEKEGDIIGKGVVPDSFTLIANYRDPFLGNISRSISSISGNNPAPVRVAKVAPPPKVVVPEAPIDLSFIAFSGLITNPATSKKVALVSLNGQQYMVSEGELINEVAFKKNYRDSIEIFYKNKTFYIKRKR